MCEESAPQYIALTAFSLWVCKSLKSVVIQDPYRAKGSSDSVAGLGLSFVLLLFSWLCRAEACEGWRGAHPSAVRGRRAWGQGEALLT